MRIVPCCHTEQAAIFGCAQAGCERCLEYLVEKHIGLVHACIQRAEFGGVPYGEMVEEGRIGLWRAIMRYDPTRQAAFSTFAWRRIWGQVWRYVERFRTRWESLEEEPYEACCAELAEAAWEQEQIAGAVREAIEVLPERLRGVMEQRYGLGGQPPRSLAEIGQAMGVSRERVRQLQNEGMALLRLPAISLRLRGLCLQDNRQAYRQARRRTDSWLQSRRKRK